MEHQRPDPAHRAAMNRRRFLESGRSTATTGSAGAPRTSTTATAGEATDHGRHRAPPDGDDDARHHRRRRSDDCCGGRRRPITGAAGRRHDQDRLRVAQDRAAGGLRRGRRLHPGGHPPDARRRPGPAHADAGRDHRRGQPVRPESRRRGRRRADHRATRSSSWSCRTRPTPPTRWPTSARQRRAVRLDRRAVAAAVLRTAAATGRGREWTYHFFWGLEDIIAVFLDMWVADRDQQGGRRPVARTTPTATRGATPSAASRRLRRPGSRSINTGRFENGPHDFSAQISAFKRRRARSSPVCRPPAFTTFWSRPRSRASRPKVATDRQGARCSRARSTRSATDGDGLTTEVWWTPNHPFLELTHRPAAELADAYTEATSPQWTQPIGFAHALFEVALDALNRSGRDRAGRHPRRRRGDRSRHHRRQGPVGSRRQRAQERRQDALVGGQWTKAEGGEFAYDMVIVSNKDHPDIPAVGTLRPIPGS